MSRQKGSFGLARFVLNFHLKTSETAGVNKYAGVGQGEGEKARRMEQLRKLAEKAAARRMKNVQT